MNCRATPVSKHIVILPIIRFHLANGPCPAVLARPETNGFITLTVVTAVCRILTKPPVFVTTDTISPIVHRLQIAINVRQNHLLNTKSSAAKVDISLETVHAAPKPVRITGIPRMQIRDVFAKLDILLKPVIQILIVMAAVKLVPARSLPGDTICP